MLEPMATSLISSPTMPLVTQEVGGRTFRRLLRDFQRYRLPLLPFVLSLIAFYSLLMIRMGSLCWS